MTRTAGARIGCQRPSRFWGLGCPKIYHEVEDTLAHRLCASDLATRPRLPFCLGGIGGSCFAPRVRILR
ncbi:hypothetical protein [Thiolapillus sp.]|uniref:hypothetical protein n=1 Tax=Thiolapillus sp. TaxID=2017437 RepID=UPI00263B6EF2|nr:hypothetical protein [Thiolapillus sp.]